jgi:hypothetical protein
MNVAKKRPKRRKVEERQGYHIIECRNEFGSVYYTIVNPITNSHVHARSIKIARNICKEAAFFMQYGSFHSKSPLDITLRAAKLALRPKVVNS